MLLIVLHVIAIGLLISAFARSLQYRRGRRVFVAWLICDWTPPYAPHFKTVETKRAAGNGFTVEEINARRDAAEAIRTADNTEFIPGLLAWRCRACSAMYADWNEGFRCHKRNM